MTLNETVGLTAHALHGRASYSSAWLGCIFKAS